MENLWGVEHSNTQNCFHIDTIEKILAMNLNNYLCGGCIDYQLLFIGTYEECDNFIKKITK